jgi:hypothetical protein
MPALSLVCFSESIYSEADEWSYLRGKLSIQFSQLVLISSVGLIEHETKQKSDHHFFPILCSREEWISVQFDV